MSKVRPAVAETGSSGWTNPEGKHGAGFVALVSRLESFLGGSPVGTDASPATERIRFRADPGLCFSTSDYSVDSEADGAKMQGRAPRSTVPTNRVEIRTRFLGLTGADGPLPSHWLDAAARDEDDSVSYRALLDVFHHRTLSLFYRAFRRSRPDWWGASEFMEHVSSLAGTTSSGISPPVRRALTPYLATGARCSRTVETAVGRLFELDPELSSLFREVEPHLREHTGATMPVDPDDQFRLGLHRARLGIDATLGRSWGTRAGRCCLRIQAKCERLPAPATTALVSAKVESVLRLFVVPSIHWDMELQLSSDEPAPAFGNPLGRRTWLSASDPSAHRVIPLAHQRRNQPLEKETHHAT